MYDSFIKMQKYQKYLNFKKFEITIDISVN